jgi:hypothetical protein
MSPTTPIRLIDLFRYYKGLPHQNAAILELEQRLLKADPSAFNRDQDWYGTWSSAVPAKTPFKNAWDGVYESAKAAGAKYPECVAAQWALESGWGKHTSGENNFFGLKGSGTGAVTKEFIDGQWVTITDEFIDFPSGGACIEYLVNHWYKDYKNHHGVNRAKDRDECAQLLVKEGYATDPGYAKKLIRIMNENCKPAATSERILDVPYEYQLDNASGTGYRECFSSTCAMIARYHGQIDSDDEYNTIRGRFGDTTNPHAQIDTLRSLGFDARFVTKCNSTFLENEINAGRPVAVGWLHKGTIQSPSGGGHWSCCIGYTKDDFVFNDPNGEADMVNGGYVNNSAAAGRGVHYSRKNWLRRWEVDGANTGWAIIVKPEF